MMQTVGVFGGSGFVGRHLTVLLAGRGYKVVIFSRSAPRPAKGNITYARWDPGAKAIDTAALQSLHAAVNLAGAGIADKRLTPARKKEIVDSRVESTAFLLASLRAHAPRCATFVAASAIGFYGPDHGGQPFAEAAPPSTGFLGDTCRLWEAASQHATSFLRTVIIRIGIVLGREGGAYPRLAAPLSFGIMPILGGGRQVVSWVSVHDLARLFAHALQEPSMSGIYNGVAPHPVTHSALMHAIRKAHGGIAIPVPVPAFILRLALGEMAAEVLQSCTVSAAKTLSTGFTFDHPDIAGALEALK